MGGEAQGVAKRVSGSSAYFRTGPQAIAGGHKARLRIPTEGAYSKYYPNDS
jgi:hypothetical protein